MVETRKYKVLGIEGEQVDINGVMYDGGIGFEIELTDEEAAQPLSEFKIELMAPSIVDGSSTGIATVVEEETTQPQE